VKSVRVSLRVDSWDRVEGLFFSAVDLPHSEQEQFLDHACFGDTELRAEVESLLQSDRKNGASISAAVETEAALLIDSPFPGERLGAYRVLREIGRGGMGAVYLAARDDDQYRKNVAIKVVKRGMDTDAVLTRFRYERQILANLDHPYIAHVLDGGSTADGRPFFVMEYVQGRPVTEFSRQAALDVDARCRLFLRICEAVAHAHRNLVIHRDLKPGNILVAADGTPRLLDFGVAKLLGGHVESRGTTLLTEQRFTPDYASPEQVRGLPMTTATDVYSLGAVLYELLAERRPHQITGYATAEVERAVCNTEIIRPSAWVRNLDADLDNIVLMAMRKEPDRRYASVDQFAEDIRRYLDGRPIAAREDSFGYSARKLLGRHRWEVAAGAVVFASLVTATVTSETQVRRAEAHRIEAVQQKAHALAESRRAEIARQAEAIQRDIADQQRDEAERQRARAERRVSDLVDLANRTLFDVHTAIESLPGGVGARRKIIETTLDYLARLEKEDGQDERIRVVLSEAYYKIGMIQGDGYGPSLEDFDGARVSFHKAKALLAPLYHATSGDPDLMLRWISVEAGLADLVYRAGRREEAAKALLRLLPIAHRLGVLRPSDLASARQEALLQWRLADVLHYQDAEQGLEHANREIALLHGLIARFPGDASLKQELGVGLGMAAGTLMRMGELERAAELYSQSIQLREQLRIADPNNVALQRGLLVTYGNYAGILGVPFFPNLGQLEEARAACIKSLTLARQLAGADPQDVTARIDVAASLTRLGSIDPKPGAASESLAQLQEAIDLLEPVMKTNQKSSNVAGKLALAREYAGYRLENLGRPREAEEQYRQSLAETEPFADSGDASMIVQAIADEEALAQLFASQDDRTAALDFAGRALALAQKYSASPPTDDNRLGHMGRAYFVLASVQSKFNDSDSARETAQKAAATWRTIHNRSVLTLHHKAVEDTGTLVDKLILANELKR
jgi:tetratricopeptide (TPR) repeat protein/predicted Ser/Thr protein kinase